MKIQSKSYNLPCLYYFVYIYFIKICTTVSQCFLLMKEEKSRAIEVLNEKRETDG